MANPQNLFLPSNSKSIRWGTLGICAILTALILIAFGRAIHYPYVILDDLYYLSKNDMIKSGLNWKSIQWAFTTFQTQDWQPLTWLSWILSVQFFGLNPAVSHSINILLHLLNTLLLFYVLRKYTGTFWRAALVAAFFAIHPLRVESVVWVSELKDDLAGVFWMLSMLAYYRYIQKPSVVRMFLLCLAFLLGLMSKPVLVTLPLILFLLDYWPLKRFEKGWKKLLIEKIPLFLLSFFSCLMTVSAARGSLVPFTKIPIHLRIINAFSSYGSYLLKTFWPHPLVNFYPHPMEHYSKIMFVFSVLVLAAITVWAFYKRLEKPFVLVGWLWFLITLFPMAGFIQVGAIGMADRYTYFAHIGFFIMLVWAMPERKLEIRSFFLPALVIFFWTLLSFVQTGYWRDSRILDRHTLDVTGQNPIVQSNLEYAVVEKGIANDDVDSLLKFFAKPYNIEVPSKKSKTS